MKGAGSPPRRRRVDHPATRLAALLIALGAGWVLWRLPATEAPSRPLVTARPAAPAAPPESCTSRRRAEIEALRAAGEVSAEMAMRLRQAIAQDCAAPQ
jgi:hypothetical protein